MKVRFLEPPLEKRTGGLEAAISGLTRALRECDVAVTRDDDGECPRDSADVFHFHGLWEPRFARIGTELRRNGKPYVISPHGMLEPWAWRHKAWKKWPYFYAVERRFLAGAATLLSTSPSEAAAITRRMAKLPVAVLPLGLTGDTRPDYSNARRLLGWRPGERVLLYLSRLHVKKGLELLLEALSALSHGTDVRLVIVGGGDPAYLDSLHILAHRLHANLPKVDWVGEVWGDARWPYFQGADLFCLPSHSENFGLAVLDALQVGTPVLTTSATPWPAYLTAERGFIADPTVESVKDALIQFFSGPAVPEFRRSEISRWAHTTFNWPALGRDYQALYENVLQRTGTYCAA